MNSKIYQSIARKIQSIANCEKSGNTVWEKNHIISVIDLMRKTSPSGSGIDSGTQIELTECTENKLVFLCQYHHMNENGFYDGWTTHKIIVTPDLASGFNIRITGRDRNQIKEYLYEVYSNWLNEETEN